MSRTIVDIPKHNIERLDSIAQEEGVSRAELMREAVTLFLEQRKKKKSGAIVGPDIRGTVKPGDPRYWEGMDGIEWQRKMRAEWDDRDALYDNWGKLTPEEWNERLRRYNAGEKI